MYIHVWIRWPHHYRHRNGYAQRVNKALACARMCVYEACNVCDACAACDVYDVCDVCGVYEIRDVCDVSDVCDVCEVQVVCNA